MILGTFFVLLLGVGVAPPPPATPVTPLLGEELAAAPVCRTKYTDKWPHCVNIKCMTTARSNFEADCAKDSRCNGYSFTASQISNANGRGFGCLKQQCANDGKNGFGQKSHGYRECPKACTTKYTKKWPHCVNIKCMTTSRSKFEADCLADARCNGYSFTASQVNKANGRGFGCLKQKCENDGTNGFGQRSHGYRECYAGGKPAPPENNRVCRTKYTTKWPHCVNIKCMTASRSQFEEQCKQDKRCNGYSFTASQIGNANGRGFGCLKQQCVNDGKNGFGQKSHGYRECGVLKKVCTTKYTTKWPHCVNIRCLSGSRKKFESQCLKDKRCNGYSFTASTINQASGRGSGCLKQQCVNDGKNGFGQRSHGYRECKDQITSLEEEEYESEQPTYLIAVGVASIMLIGIGAITLYKRQQEEYKLISEV